MHKVSIILTTYNSSASLQEVLDSLFSQQGIGHIFDLEIVAVDDSSSDNTIEILERNSVRYMKTEKNTGGPNYGRNLALSICTGDYICFIDHDDIWFPHKIKSLLSVADLAPIITSGYTMLDSHRKRKNVRVNNVMHNTPYVLYKKNETFIQKLTKSRSGQETYLGSIMFHRSLKDILFETKYGMIDFDWVLRLFHNNSSVEFCDSLYLRKVSINNLSLNETYRLNDYKFSMAFILNYQKDFSREVEIAANRINGSLARYYYLIDNMTLARKYFLKSTLEIKTILYLITTFAGSKIVKRYFNVFG